MDAKSTDASSGATPAAAAPSSLDIVSINSKTVVKAFDLPVVSDTYNSLVKLSSPLIPIVEKVGSLASPAMDQVLGLKAGIESKVPEVITTGFNSALAQVTRLICISQFIFICTGHVCSSIFRCQTFLRHRQLGRENARLEASHAGALRLHQVIWLKCRNCFKLNIIAGKV